MEKNRQWPQFLAVFLAGFLSIGSGIQFAWSSPSVPKLLSGELGYDVSTDEASYIVMFSPVGYMVGSFLCGLFLDRIGRKYTLLALGPIQIISWITIIFSRNIIALYASRLMMGLTDGGLFIALPVYIGEIAEPKVRGVASASLSMGLLTGNLLINSYGSFMSIKAAACISLVAPALFLMTFVWMPESPYYLLAKSADEKARKSLKSLRRSENVEDELDNLRKAVYRQMAEPGSLKDIFTVDSNLRAFLILMGLRTIQQLSGLYTTGFYLQTIFGYTDTILNPKFSAILCSTMRLPLTFIGSLMIDKFGRRTMLSTSSSGTGCCLAVIAIYFNLKISGYDVKVVEWLPLIVMIIYYIFGSMGIFIVPNLMTGELLATNVKAKALAILNIYLGLSMSAVTKLFQWTESRLGIHVPFYIFTSFCILGVLFIYMFVPETKGKSLEEIQYILKGPKYVKDKNPSKNMCKLYTVTSPK